MRILPALAATGILVLGMPALTHAQATDSDTQRTTMNDRDDDSGKMGWLGLLGLAGLMGLKRRDRDDHVVRRDNTGSPSRM
jgi:MYXO-CTERM domain-containing protein